jgi:hypothetical protein
VQIQVPPEGKPVTRESFHFRVDKSKLQKAEAQDGHYLLRSNLVGGNRSNRHVEHRGRTSRPSSTCQLGESD